MNDIYYLRLTSGEEIVAEVTTNAPTLILNNPLLIEVNADDEGSQTIILSRFNPYAKDMSFEIEKSNIMVMQTVSEDMQDYYTKSLDFCTAHIDKNFSSGIRAAASYLDQVLKQLMITGQIDVSEIERVNESDEFIEEQENHGAKPTFH